MIAVKAFDIPKHWAQLGRIDFGWDHPTAAVRIAHDRDADCVYVIDAYRVRQETPAKHSAELRHWNVPFAWPQRRPTPNFMVILAEAIESLVRRVSL
jgi:hypothetical protein